MRNLVNHAHAAKENMKCMVNACTNLETQYLDSDDTCTNLIWICTCSSAQTTNFLPNEATQATAAVKDSRHDVRLKSIPIKMLWGTGGRVKAIRYARPEGVRESVNLQDRSILSGGNYMPMDVPPY